MMIIGITGTIGAGKGTVVDFLIKKYNFAHFSVRNYLEKILNAQNKECNRDNFTVLANSLRKTNNSPSYIIEQLYSQALKTNKNCIIESIRTVGEISKLKEMGHFILLSVDADIEIRYQRIKNRKSNTDNIDFENFKLNEKRELKSSNPHEQNIEECMLLADYKLLNNSNLNDFNKSIEEVVLKIQNKNNELY